MKAVELAEYHKGSWRNIAMAHIDLLRVALGPAGTFSCCANRLRSRFVHYIEGRLRGSAEAAEPGRGYNLSNVCLPRLRP